MLKTIKEFCSDDYWFITWHSGYADGGRIREFKTEAKAREAAEQIAAVQGYTVYVYHGKQVATVKARTEYDWKTT